MMSNYSEKLKDQIIFFTAEEIKLINRHGEHYERLIKAGIFPLKRQGSRFFSIMHKNLQPETPVEVTWSKFQIALKNIENLERYTDKIKIHEEKIAFQEQRIKKLQARIFELEEIPKEENRSKLLEQMKKQDPIIPEKSFQCIICNGDGGATGNCPRCGGNGIEP